MREAIKMSRESPISKIYEAYSALADKRIEKINDSLFLVESSDHSKRYTVKIDEKGIYSSNDNATLWQHYAGYPILAVLMEEGKLPYEKFLLSYFVSINWKKLNTEAKNKYDIAIEKAFSSFTDEERSKIQKAVEETRVALVSLSLEVKGNRAKILPPKEAEKETY